MIRLDHGTIMINVLKFIFKEKEGIVNSFKSFKA
jgi:hypothetical protein